MKRANCSSEQGTGLRYHPTPFPVPSYVRLCFLCLPVLQPWLCFSVQFKDRTIDLVASNEHEVTAWFLGLQAQAPMTVSHMSRGMILWQRSDEHTIHAQSTHTHPKLQSADFRVFSILVRRSFPRVCVCVLSRLIMKMNWYSLEQIKRVFAKREQQAMQQRQMRQTASTP